MNSFTFDSHLRIRAESSGTRETPFCRQDVFRLLSLFSVLAALATLAAIPAHAELPILGVGAQPELDDGVHEGRVENGLQALFDFDENRGEVLEDRSGIEPALRMRIGDLSRVRWGEGNLELIDPTKIETVTTPDRLINRIRETNAFTVEVWCQPANLQQSGPARIVSLSSDPTHRNVTLGQDATNGEIRIRTSDKSENGTPGVASGSDQITESLVHLIATHDVDGTTHLYVDGERVATGQDAGDLSNWNQEYQLIFGNEASLDRPWLGKLHLVAIYDRALTADEVSQNFAFGADAPSRYAELLPPPADFRVDFVKDVKPILREHCYECHSTGNEEAALNLALKSRALEGGESGRAISSGNSVSSPIIHVVSGLDQDRMMPPDGEPLTAEQVGILRAWIDQGADWPLAANESDPRIERAREHWAFQPFADEPAQATIDGSIWAVTPIDHFIETELNERGLQATPPIDARGLIRRVTFDLIGLPPSPEEVDAFLVAHDANPQQAVHDLVDRLLASRHYGERWGRHWLDVARYADSDGQEADRDRPYAYHYRDFVIRAFNEDMPFDQFVRWQIAGDEYEPTSPDAIAATGFLTAGPHTKLENQFLEEERLRNRYNELDDIVSTYGTAMLGVTLGCARCHDHKYDAISAREYYRILAAFHSGDRKIVDVRGGDKVLAFQDFGSTPRTTWLFGRGDFVNKDSEVQLGFPAALTRDIDAEAYWNRARDADVSTGSTMQRRALADWTTDTEGGAGTLLARVYVNRVWYLHFGEGLVSTVSDFGVRGETPSHPELLDWLTQDFVRNGWEIKRLHRMIIASAVYQQDITFNEANAKIDPENRMLWRMRPRRLEAESIRDAMLAISGQLNLKPFGPGFKPFIPKEANSARNLKDGGYPDNAKDEPATQRRSVYMFHKRLVPYPLFQAFDRPDLLQSCGRRENTTVAPQALAILNDVFVRDRAADFSKRLIADCGESVERIVAESFELAFAREATAKELSAARDFINEQIERRKVNGSANPFPKAVTDYCHALFGLNEFIYVD